MGLQISVWLLVTRNANQDWLKIRSRSIFIWSASNQRWQLHWKAFKAIMLDDWTNGSTICWSDWHEFSINGQSWPSDYIQRIKIGLNNPDHLIVNPLIWSMILIDRAFLKIEIIDQMAGSIIQKSFFPSLVVTCSHINERATENWTRVSDNRIWTHGP